MIKAYKVDPQALNQESRELWAPVVLKRDIEDIKVKIDNTRAYLRSWVKTIPTNQAIEFVKLMKGETLEGVDQHKMAWYMRQLRGLNSLKAALARKEEELWKITLLNRHGGHDIDDECDSKFPHWG